MKLNLACADFTYPILPHDQSLQMIAMLGLKGVDIGLFQDRSHLQPTSEFANVRRSARNLKKRLDNHGLAAADIFLQLALDYQSRAVNHPSTRRRRFARDAFQNCLDYTAECKGRHVTILPGVHHPGESRRDSLARAADELAWRVEGARAYSIVLAIEPHTGSFANTPKRAKQLVSDVPGLTLTLDHGHLYPRGYSEEEVNGLFPYTSHFHARFVSNKGGPGTLEGNTLNWKKVLRAMDKADYKGWIELEYGGNDITQTVLLRDYLRKLMS